MKYLLTLVFVTTSICSFAQKNVSTSNNESHHMLVIDGIFSRVFVPYNIYAYGQTIGKTYVGGNVGGMALGYRYCPTENFRAGVNVSFNTTDIRKPVGVFTGGVHIDLPFNIGDRFLLGPGVNFSYVHLEDVHFGNFAVGGSIGLMYKLNRTIGINLEPGVRLNMKRYSGYEFPVHAGIRLML
ncbi:MAG: hypothetical protein J0L80_17335 [Chitinophagales bacterium]|nr:hypothetical protein [Chitinophagales bacterium]